MRFGNPRLARIASLVRGAIVERGDGELRIGPQLNNIISLEGPVNRVFSGAVPDGIDDSHFDARETLRTGVNAQSNFLMAKMTKGKWQFNLSSQFMFTGTNLFTVTSQFYLQDPDLTIYPVISWPHITGRQGQLTYLLDITFQRDNWAFGHLAQAIVAGDVQHMYNQYWARRIV